MSAEDPATEENKAVQALFGDSNPEGLADMRRFEDMTLGELTAAREFVEDERELERKSGRGTSPLYSALRKLRDALDAEREERAE